MALLPDKATSSPDYQYFPPVSMHMNKTFSILLLILLYILPLSLPLAGQELEPFVERCKVLSQSSPINNIWVDEDNIKWVANSEGLHKVLGINMVQKVSIPSGSTNLLTIRGGNANIEWNTAEMNTLLGNVTISSASYDPKTKSLWIGTQDEGAFQVSISPLRVMQRFNMANKKLTSNQINDIFIHNNGSIWIATDDGMLSGSGDKWTLQERFLNFVGVDAFGSNMWILGDDFLWQVDSKGKWSPIAIELKNVEGKLRDIAVDGKGRVWIASNMMTGFDVEANRYQRFGPGQYFTSQYVNCLDVDQDGSIWTGTGDKGLYLLQWESSLVVLIMMDAPLDCKTNQPTGALSVKVSGGEPPYTYLWSNGQTTDKISQLGAGEYVLTVTDSKGLLKTTKYTIPDPMISIAVEIIKPSSGSPEGDASVNLLVNGGTGNMVYAWDNGEAKQMAVKLTAGTHAVTVTDESGCSATTAFAVPEKVSSLAVTISILAENKCANEATGIIQADVKGGKPPIKYQWSQGSATEGKLTGVAPGDYAVTVADAAGQTAVGFVKLAAPPKMELAMAMLSASNVGVDNGQAQIKVTGGKAPYTYAWDNGITTALVKTLSSGEHIITVTDATGCSATATVNVSENIATLGVIIKQVGQINCSGQATASLRPDISGGKGPYTYVWSNGQTTATAENLNAGTYTLTVTDVTGSKFTATSTVTEPQPVTLTATADAPASTNGSDGKATAKGSGGSGTYQYAWDNGEAVNKAVKLPAGTHTVTVTDAAGCSASSTVTITENILALQVVLEQVSTVKCAGNSDAALKAVVKGGKEPYTYTWSNGGTTANAEKLKAGAYSLTVTDVVGTKFTAALNIPDPQPVTATAITEAAASTNGSDGKASVKGAGGTGAYTYAWDNGETTSKAIKLPAGTHVVTVTDANGCSATSSVVVTENILPLAVNLKQTEKILCGDQTNAAVAAAITGGKPPYDIKWKGPGKEWTGDEALSQLGPGQYAIQVLDANGSSATSTIEVTAPKPLVVTAEEISPANTGNADGSVTLKAAGGTTPYTIEGHTWSTSSPTHKIEELKPGTFTYIVKDAAGCTASVEVKITEDILPLSVTIKQTDKVLCAGSATAGLESAVKGGKPPYTYAWSGSAATASVKNLAEGTYQLNVTDAIGQKAQAEFKITGPPQMKVDPVNLRSATNDRISDGKGSVEVKGGTEPYTYKWNSGETSLQATKLPLGPGTIVVTDANGCTASADYLIKEKVLPELTATKLATGEPIRMEKIQFDADSIVIKPEAVPSLDELYEFLYDNPTTIIEVSGHTNNLPADDYCDRISTARAKSVADYLISKGIEARRVISIGYGKRKPIAPNQTPEGRKKNQRVEIRLIKIEE